MTREEDALARIYEAQVAADLAAGRERRRVRRARIVLCVLLVALVGVTCRACVLLGRGW